MRIEKKNGKYLLTALLLVLLDQMVKNGVRGTIPLHASRALWPGVLELSYVQNTGAAFSMLSEHTWLLAIISAVAALVLLWVLLRGIFPHSVGQLALALVLGGAVGNLIDRVWLGYVVDMFSLQFVNFAVFNIADIGVTVGGVLLCAYILFFWKQEQGKLPETAVSEEIVMATKMPEEEGETK